MNWQCASYSFDVKMPIVMGILNVTPDSFSDGGEHNTHDAAIAHAKSMIEQGAKVIDVGGESTRPGSAEVSVAEELSRTGAAIINDVSGFRDPAMVEVARSCDAGLVVMHMKGEPHTMQDDPVYDDVVVEVRDYLAKRAAELEAAGIAHDRICLDPGPGFGKTASQTMELMRNFHEIARLGYPSMVAVSRKRYIGKAYGIEDPHDRDRASAAEALMACELGAGVVRAHNVEETLKALKDLRPYCYLGLGCNVALVAEPGEEREGKIAQIEHAISQLCMIPDSQIVDVSSYYESEPAYYLDQEPFVNAVVLMRTGVAPKELLEYLHAIENSLGRVREIENGPRTCDVDILDYQLYVVDNDVLTLPHPRICERDFVVKPLLEISPNHVLADGTPVASIPEDQRVGHAVKL